MRLLSRKVVLCDEYYNHNNIYTNNQGYNMSRFAFIKNKDANLYKLCLQAEERVTDDIDVYMLKCRRALECIVTIAGCRGNNLYQKVEDINNNLKISREMKHKIFKFKDACNENIHYEDETGCNKADAYVVLDQLEEICHWLVEAIIDKQVQEVITDNVKILEQKQKELVEAFKNNDIEAITLISEAIKRLSQQQGETISKIKDNSDKDLNKQTADLNKEHIITILGGFSRGKSTLINALLGAKVLPSSKRATTVVNTKISYGDTNSYYKKLKDGTISNISETEFQGYKAENLKNGLKLFDLDSLSVKVSSPFCKNNITIIDTPGDNINNLPRYKDLTDVSEIVILLLCTSMCLCNDERAFIKEFKKIMVWINC